jgi:inorganic pyrophosphatase
LEIAHFFEIYKDLEPNKATEPGGWGDRQAAEQEIAIAMRRFEESTPR